MNKPIGGVKVYTFSDFTYVLPEDIPEEYKDEFFKWHYGQTGAIVDSKPVIFSWDWERWYKLKTKGISTYFD